MLGVCAEDMRPLPPGNPARVKMVGPAGADLQVILEVYGTEMTAVFRVRLPLQAGQEDELPSDAKQLYLFHPTTENHIA